MTPDPSFPRDMAYLAVFVVAALAYLLAWRRVRQYELLERPDDARGLASSLAMFATFGCVGLPLVCGIGAAVVWGMWQ